MRLGRRRWHAAGHGTRTPLDVWVASAEATISLGVRAMACRRNGDGKNFDKAAANLARTAQVAVSGETLRQLVETEGQRVVRAQQSGALAVGWSAADCQTATGTTRLYFGSDGVMVPLVTAAEKRTRRDQIKRAWPGSVRRPPVNLRGTPIPRAIVPRTSPVRINPRRRVPQDIRRE